MQNRKLKNNKFNAVSLFSGCGGLDIGVSQAGFNILFANEFDSAAVETLKINHPQICVDNRSILDLNAQDIINSTGISEFDLLLGGPPCQAFSVFGNRKGIKDSRGMMIFEFLRITKDLKPKVFIMENVRGLLSMPFAKESKNKKTDNFLQEKGSLLKVLVNQFNEIGYSVDLYVTNSANYGSPQIRERIFLIGNRYGIKSSFPKPTHSNRDQDKLKPFKTLGDVIGKGFIDYDKSCMNFSERKLHYLSKIPPGGNWRSLTEDIQKESMGKSWYLKGGRSAYWRKLSMDFPSPTVVTMPNHAGTSMCHPYELRAITVGEAAAIQEFPRNYIFFGSVTEKMRQIGNAVPVGLAKVAAKSALEVLIKIEEGVSNKSSSPFFNEEHIRPHIRTRSFYKKGVVFKGHTPYKSSLADINHLDLLVDAS